MVGTGTPARFFVALVLIGSGMEQNLFSGGHAEFTDPATRPQFGRSVFLKVVGRFRGAPVKISWWRIIFSTTPS